MKLIFCEYCTSEALSCSVLQQEGNTVIRSWRQIHASLWHLVVFITLLSCLWKENFSFYVLDVIFIVLPSFQSVMIITIIIITEETPRSKPSTKYNFEVLSIFCYFLLLLHCMYLVLCRFRSIIQTIINKYILMDYYRWSYPAVYKVFKMSFTFKSFNIKVMNTWIHQGL